VNISVSTLAECPFSIADEYAQEYLRNAEAGGIQSLVRVPWFRPLPALARRVQMTFGLHKDVTEPGREHEEIRLRWTSGTRMLPNFRGTLHFRIEALRTRIFIDGTYDAPLGLLGRCFDQVIGKRIARASMQDLADRLATFLEQREREWQAKQVVAS
jgi:hypothetical protein